MSTIVQMPVRVNPPPADTGDTISPGCASLVVAIIPTADRAKATVKVRVGFAERDAGVLPEMGARVAFLRTEQ